MKTTSTMELDLNDVATVEALIQADAVKSPSVPAKEIEDKIRQKQKLASFTMKLAESDIESLKRQASAKNLEWRQYLQNEIEAKIFSAKIGAATIQTPSMGLEPTKKITGPSAGSTIRRTKHNG